MRAHLLLQMKTLHRYHYDVLYQRYHIHQLWLISTDCLQRAEYIQQLFIRDCLEDRPNKDATAFVQTLQPTGAGCRTEL